MKKILVLCLCLALLMSGLCSCKPQETPSADNPPAKDPVIGNADTLPITEPLSLQFLSGAGAWSTDLMLYPDGSFVGSFHDSNMGETGKGYPHGTVYTCDFEGRFVGVKKISDTLYTMHLVQLTAKKEAGTEWIEDEIRYVAATPYGLTADIDDEFYFYTPDAPVNRMEQAFLSWWPGRYEDPRPTTLSCYGIYNEDEETGFFSDMAL